MSDTRDDAEQEMVNAGIAGGLEDSLGVSDPEASVTYREKHEGS